MAKTLAYSLEDPLINAAADQINSFTPQAVPQQTILIGTFDGFTNQFAWNLEEGYPDGLPDDKKAEYGGSYQPDHIAKINSFNVKYEFRLRNKPENFQLTLFTPDSTGTMVAKLATIKGDLASVTFNPYSIVEQIVIIHPVPASPNQIIRIKPFLAAQLGAFVVPHLLISILYEPPGALTPFATSWASFGQRNTASTTLTWGFEQSSGLVQTVSLDWFTQQLEILEGIAKAGKVAGEYLDAFYSFDTVKVAAEKASGVLDVLRFLQANEAQVTTTQGQIGEHRVGTSISVEIGVKTDVEDGSQYPGQGDRFVHLDDVLFVYMAYEGKVLVTPTVYKRWHAPNPTELKEELPEELANHWLSLDPLLPGGPHIPPLRSANLPFPNFPHSPSLRFERPSWLPTAQCEDAPNYVELTQEKFISLRAGQMNSKTIIKKANGLEALLGLNDELQSVTYWSSLEQYEDQTTVSYVELQCSPNEQFEVEFYIDKVFRTLLPIRGQPLSVQAMVAGSVIDVAGHPIPSQWVYLKTSDRMYRALTDQQGNFHFFFSSLPKGNVFLIVEQTKQSITLTGSPITGLKLRVQRGQNLQRRVINGKRAEKKISASN